MKTTQVLELELNDLTVSALHNVANTMRIDHHKSLLKPGLIDAIIHNHKTCTKIPETIIIIKTAK